MRREIKIRLLERDLQVPDLARKIGRSGGYLSRALNDKVKLRTDEAFAIADILNLSNEQVREFFG